MAKARAKPLLGNAKPRIAPPTPARSLGSDIHDLAHELGIDFFPWQDIANRYLYALGPGDAWLYPEVAIVVARQNGKTELLVPHITKRLLMGRRIMHTAQNRELPREVFGRVADIFTGKYRDMLSRNPRFANGQEEIRLRNGGHYRIVAPNRGGARGPSNDDLILDEVRELVDHSFPAAAKPTLNAAPKPQTLYLSNMGDDTSVVLNALKTRSGLDPSLAFLEWSAAPERDPGDIKGWLESNPSAGHMPQIIPNLEREFRAHSLSGTMSIFETEHLCRMVVSMRERLLDDNAWQACTAESELVPRQPFMGVSSSPDGSRASAALAWQQADGTVALQVIFDVTGNPIDVQMLGTDLRNAANRLGVTEVLFDPLTDGELAKYFRKATPIAGQKFANASARFVTAVNAGSLRHFDCSAVTTDLAWTARKEHDESGSYQAVRANDDRPITAVLAAIRAVWMASGPAKPRVARIY